MGRKKVELVQVEVNGSSVDAKECTKCKLVKPLTEYHKQKRCVGGRTPHCKFCIRKKQYESRYGLGVEVPEVSKQKTREIVVLELNGRTIDAKECNKCLELKPLSEFSNHSKGLGGKDQTCKKCVIKRTKEWKKENPEKSKEYSRNWARRKRETDSEFREKQRIMCKNRYHENRDEYAKRWKVYYRENKEQLLEKGKAHYHNNREKYSERWREYAKSPRGQEVISKIRHRRRALEMSNSATLTSEQWRKCVTYFGNSCAYCGTITALTKDHFIPVSKGGNLEVSNVIPACLSCNASKQAKDFFEWYPSYRYYNRTFEIKILEYLGIKDDGTQQLAML